MIEDDDSFLKQRRNIFVTSILLIIIQFAEVSLSNTIKTSYITMEIGKPQYIIYMLLLMHIYLLIRYFQTKPSKAHNLSTLYYSYRMLYLGKAIIESALEHEKSYKDFQEDLNEMQEQKERNIDPYEEERRREISPDIINTTKEILDYKIIKNKKLTEVVDKIEHYDTLKYRWQFPKGRGEEETHFTHDFDYLTIIKSYFFGLFTMLFSSAFSTYQLPSFIGFIIGVMFLYNLM